MLVSLELVRKVWFLVASIFTGVVGLRNVEIKVPPAVRPGDSVTITCHYDLEGDPLYTVKWYKGRHEFFRYVPKELPHTRVFPLPGVNVDISASGPSKVVLHDVQKDLSGKYRCEVSADAPNFHTKVVSTYMHVIHSLVGVPRILLEKTRYSVGDTLRGNCTAPPSSPPANITWIVNGHKTMPKSIRHLMLRNAFEEEVRMMTIADLVFVVDVTLAPAGGKLEVRCVADIYGTYETETKVLLTEERPRLASVLATRDSTSGSYKYFPGSCWLLSVAAILSS